MPPKKMFDNFVSNEQCNDLANKINDLQKDKVTCPNLPSTSNIEPPADKLSRAVEVLQDLPKAAQECKNNTNVANDCCNSMKSIQNKVAQLRQQLDDLYNDMQNSSCGINKPANLCPPVPPKQDVVNNNFIVIPNDDGTQTVTPIVNYEETQYVAEGYSGGSLMPQYFNNKRRTMEQSKPKSKTFKRNMY